MTKLIYVYSELPTYIRIKKNLALFSQLFDEILFIGANRSGGQIADESFPENVRFSIYDKKIAHGGLGSIFQSAGFAFYVLNVLRQNRADVIVFVNEELLWTTKFLTYKPRIICEVLDSLAIRTFGFVSYFEPIFKIYCNYFYKECDSIVEVSKHRLEYRKYQHTSVVVIPNSPVTSNLNLDLFPELDELDYIYVSGSVVPGVSGVEQLLEAFEVANLSSLKIVYSGRLNGNWALDVFFSKPYVINMGALSPEQSLVVANKSIAMFAFYKPINLNYIYASPNKVSDALLLAKPLLINSECEAKHLVMNAGLALCSPYNDVNSLVENLHLLVSNNFTVSIEKSNSIFRNEFSDSSISLNWKKVLINHE